MEEKKIIKLKHPITIEQKDGSKKVYDEVQVGRLQNKHLKSFPKDFFENGGKITPNKVSDVVATITELPKEVAGEMDVEDTAEVLETLQDFFKGVFQAPEMTGNG